MLRIEVDSPQVFLYRTLIEEHCLLVRMKFSGDRHYTLFHIDNGLDHISELLLRHLVQIVQGHDVPDL